MPRHASPSRKSHAHTVVASLSETPWWLASTTLEFAIIRLACMLTDDCTKIQPLPIHPHNFQMIWVHRLIHQMCFNSEINRPRNQDDENQERPVLKLARALEGASRLPRFEGGIVKSTLCTVSFSNHWVPEIWAITASWQNGTSGNQQAITTNKAASTNSFIVDAVDCNPGCSPKFWRWKVWCIQYPIK